MKIGALAKEMGVSVRTLHHYDDIGLLSPSSRGESGHRIYDKSDILRLHHILSLKRLNLSLEEIRDIIGKCTAQIESLLDQNIESLETEIGQKKETLRTLQGTRQFLAHRDDVDLTGLTDIIKDISLSQKYFSEGQLNVMDKREENLDKGEIRKILNDVPRMTADIGDAVRRKLSPSDPKVLALVKRWSEMAATLIGDENNEIVTTAKKIVAENPSVLERHNLNEETLDYIRKAKEYL